VKKAPARRTKKQTPRRRRPLTFDDVRDIGRELPGVEDATMYGTPALRVHGKGIVRLREEGDLALWVTFDERDHLLRNDPGAFYITDHYRNYPMILARLDVVDHTTLRELIHGAWRRRAPKRVVAAYDAGNR
jgi:hypothetical protein